MKTGSIVMLGWPDSGKTNYLAALWDALRERKGAILAPTPPDEIRYVEDALAFQSRGEFAPRSDKNIEESRKDFTVQVALRASPRDTISEIVVPDITGELWKAAVETTEISEEWMQELRKASGALLFIRVRSKLNCTPLDWVTTERLLALAELSEKDEEKAKGLPTQIILCELIRFLEHTLQPGVDGSAPRVAIVVSAWDLMDAASRRKGPAAFLRTEYPLLAGRIDDIDMLDISVFGVSALGGDFDDPIFKESYLRGETKGFVSTGGGATLVEKTDVTLPIAWVIGGDLPA